MSTNSYTLSNGWSIFEAGPSKLILHVKPIENNIFRKEYCVEIPQNLYDAAANGISDVEVLGKHHDLYKHATVWTKDIKPSKEKMAEVRRKKHANHLDYFYGNHWCIFEDEDHKFFLEFDVGHFASKFIAHEISSDDYKKLKNDKSLFDIIRSKLE